MIKSQEKQGRNELPKQTGRYKGKPENAEWRNADTERLRWQKKAHTGFGGPD